MPSSRLAAGEIIEHFVQSDSLIKREFLLLIFRYHSARGAPENKHSTRYVILSVVINIEREEFSTFLFSSWFGFVADKKCGVNAGAKNLCLEQMYL